MSEKTETKEKAVKKEMSIEDKVKFHEKNIGVGKVFVLEVEDKQAILRKPQRAVYGKAMAHMTPIPGIKNDPDPVKAGVVLVLGCWLEGDDEIKSDDDYLIPAAMQALQLLALKTASLSGNSKPTE